MAISKSATAFTWASGSATTSGTTDAIDCSGDYGQQVYYSLVIVGSPSGAPSFQVQCSPDGGTTWYVLTAVSPGTAAGTYQNVIDLPVTAESVRLVYTAQTGGTSSTLTAQLGQVTGI